MSDAPLAVCQHAVLGGTFDHLHSGHKIMLAVAAACAAQTLVIGLSVDELLAKKKFAAELESFESRSQVLRDYLHSLHPALCVDIHPLHDIYGPSIVLPQLQTLIVSEETRAGGQMVNDRRVERGMTPCEVVVIPLVGGASGNEPTNTTKLSSTGIRQWMAQRRTLQSLAIELKPSWDSLMRHCCVSDDDGAATWTAVVSRYSEPQRAYHSLAHVAQMLRALPESGANVAIQLAIWFHDLVYAQPEVRRDLEEQSAADFWAFVSRVSLDEQLSQRVGNMILASKQHIKTLAELDQQNMDQFSRHEMQLFLQLDLSILATDAASYDAYSEAIRIEYNQVPPADFRTGRHAFLQRLLVACDDTSTLFDAFGAAEGIRMRVQARSNVERELASLLVNHY
jgi:phosphopantetheine adenylyltransferase/predicted metal-dependent HD superfamily phosphohydrolase